MRCTSSNSSQTPFAPVRTSVVNEKTTQARANAMNEQVALNASSGLQSAQAGRQTMHIGGFIEQHIGSIVDEWVAFAHTRLRASSELTKDELADHAKVLLRAIAVDMQQ